MKNSSHRVSSEIHFILQRIVPVSYLTIKYITDLAKGRTGVSNAWHSVPSVLKLSLSTGCATDHRRRSEVQSFDLYVRAMSSQGRTRKNGISVKVHLNLQQACKYHFSLQNHINRCLAWRGTSPVKVVALVQFLEGDTSHFMLRLAPIRDGCNRHKTNDKSFKGSSKIQRFDKNN